MESKLLHHPIQIALLDFAQAGKRALNLLRVMFENPRNQLTSGSGQRNSFDSLIACAGLS